LKQSRITDTLRDQFCGHNLV